MYVGVCEDFRDILGGFEMEKREGRKEGNQFLHIRKRTLAKTLSYETLETTEKQIRNT